MILDDSCWSSLVFIAKTCSDKFVSSIIQFDIIRDSVTLREVSIKIDRVNVVEE